MTDNADAPDAPAAEAHSLVRRALELRDQGNPGDAIALLQQAALLLPDDAVLHNDLGRALLQSGRIAEAAASFERAVALRPRFARAHWQLGIAYERLGRPGLAIDALEGAVALAPKLAGAHARLAALLLVNGRRADAARHFYQAGAAAPGTPIGRLSAIRGLFLEDRFADAEAMFRRAAADLPEHAELHWLGGTLFAETGRFAEAEAAFERAVAIAPGYGTAWYDLVHCRAQMEHDRPRAGRLAAAIAEAIGTEQRVLLNLALGKLLDDLAAYAEAYAAFAAANSVRAANMRFDRAGVGRRTSAILAGFAPEVFARHGGAGAEDEQPVLLVGMPHSGIAQAEQILACHPDAAVRREASPWPAIGERLLEEGSTLTDGSIRDIGEAWRAGPGASGGLRVIDPAPFNFRWAGLFHLVFPRGRIIHCRRNPIEACLAMFFSYAPPRPELPANPPDLVFFYRQYLLLMQHWRRIIPPDRLLELDYAALAADRDAQARRLVEFCGLPWSEACLDPGRGTGRTASRWQLRQPSRSGMRWQNYAPWAGAFVQLLIPAGPARGS